VVIYQNDHLGTPQKLTAVNGAVVWSAKFSSFGKADVDASSSVTNSLRFPGQYYDQETGLHYNFFRYYNSQVGRYLRPDPMGHKGGSHPFTYSDNNSINKLDPKGLFTITGNCGGNKAAIRAAVESACNTLETTITDPKLRKCIKKRCDAENIKCHPCVNQNDPDTMGYNNCFLGICSYTIHIYATHPNAQNKFGKIAIHEWAHSCGWDHGDGQGVPGDSGGL